MSKAKKGKDILVIPDAHVRVDDNLDRIAALGKYIARERPDSVICLGDFADMNSLSSYDSALSRARVSGSYRDELRAVRRAQSLLWSFTKDLNRRLAKQKKRAYNPSKTMLIGNHEARMQRAIEVDPVVYGSVMSMEDLWYEKHWDRVVPFKEVYYEQGVGFVHYVTNMMGRAVGGAVNPANGIINQTRQSIVVGHSHIYDHKIRSKLDGTRLHGLVAGCFIGGEEEHDHHTYAQQSNKAWVDGISILHEAEDGDYDLEFINTQRLIREYL